MVNSRNLLVGSTLTIAFVAIFAYMRKNNLTTNDITLVDACWGANADPSTGNGRMNETCSDIQAQGWDWDTKIPCYNGFKESEYYYTPREMWGLNSMGRRAKGENEMIEAAKSRGDEVPDILSVLFRCNELKKDPDFSTDIPQTPPATVTEERENWWSPPPPPPCWNRPADYGNYKACSVSLAFDNTDEAECSGTKGTCGGTPCCHCSWYSRHNTGNHWLNRGCTRHDMCLEGVGSYTDAGGWCCDSMLMSAAWSCGWKIFGCSDSSGKAVLVSGSMIFAGHDGGCTKDSGSDSKRMCYGSECGGR